MTPIAYDPGPAIALACPLDHSTACAPEGPNTVPAIMPLSLIAAAVERVAARGYSSASLRNATSMPEAVREAPTAAPEALMPNAAELPPPSDPRSAI